MESINLNGYKIEFFNQTEIDKKSIELFANNILLPNYTEKII